MLTLYLENNTQKNIEKDIERLFKQIEIKGTSNEKLLIEKIEQGKYNDSVSFIDRFGFKLYNSDMSTGCKAALCIEECPDKIIDLCECGWNARDIIINFCKNGEIIIYNNAVTIKKLNEDVEIKLDDYVFTDIGRLNRYIQDERPFKPAMDGGIRHV